MKISWGYKIGAVYVFFVIGIMFLVFKSMHTKMDIVSGDYYAEELKYQDNIDKTQRAAALSWPLNVTVTGKKVQITFPADFSGKTVTGSVVLYCPADESKDLKKELNLIDNNMSVDLPANAHGYYYVKIDCASEGKTYYFEKKIFI